MGLVLRADDGPIPRQIVLVLTCDGDHGLLPAPTYVDRNGGGYIEQHARAIAAGWSETPERILCPDCKRKRK